MKIGVGYPQGLDPAAALALVEQVDRAGLDSVWIAENPYWPGAFATAGAVAARSSRVEIGIGVVSAFTRSPAVLAMEAGQVQRLSGGRLVLGLGVGGPRVLEDLGIGVARPVDAIEETLVVLRALFGEGITAHEGAVHRLRDVRLSFPVAAPPLVVGTIGPRMLAMSAAAADGIVISAHVPPAEIERIARDHRAAERTGRRGRVTAFVAAALDDDPALARARLKADVAATMVRLLRIPSLLPVLTAGELTLADLEEAAACARDGRPDDVADRVVDELCLAGDLAAVTTRLERLAAAGVDEVVLLQAAEHPGFTAHAAGLADRAHALR
ncbi:LLM class flavin-dependent oxidoreductase [Nocardioides sp. L-11A]|uniref:LLM class flavin-dependent oxidoreductase n=1 Tax=Nocardioides sp. L-11A TaxID=3043848 RepID=UPI00249B6993|nr:LLM class flavin-dependent oxidoreductase [Nocardioides sp. L-11A]